MLDVRRSQCVFGAEVRKRGGGSCPMEGDMKQIPSYGPANIRRQCTKFSLPGALEGWAPAAPVVEESFLLSPKKCAKLISFIPRFVLVIIYIYKYMHMGCVKLHVICEHEHSYMFRQYIAILREPYTQRTYDINA